MPEQKWILRSGDQLSDPVPESQIRQAMAQGKIGTDMLASQDGNHWQPLGRLFEGSALPAAPSSQFADEWMLASYDGSQYGPISKQELDEWVERGSLTADCQIRQTQDSSWRPARHLYPQLQSAASADGIPQIHTGQGGSATPVTSSYQRRSSIGAGGAALGMAILGFAILRIIFKLIQLANMN